MCEIVSAAVIVGITAIASEAVSIVSEIKAAEAQKKAIKNEAKVAREETREEATGELFDSMRAARREAGRTRAAAGEAGLSLDSGSVEALLMDSAMQSEFKNDRTLANMESRHKANTSEANSMLSRIQKPNALTAGLRLGATAVSAWTGIESAKIQRDAAAQRGS